MDISVVVDSVADLPEDLVARHGFSLVHFPVHFGERTYLDKLDLSSKEFFRLLRERKETPRTSAPSAGVYLEVFRRLVEMGKSILALTITSRHSAAYQSALLAKSMLNEGEIEVMDTGNVSMGIGLLAIKAAEMIKNRFSKEEIFARIRELIPQVQVLAMIPDITYMVKGGRISAPAAKIASILNIKPIIRIRRGVIELVSRVSGYNAAIQKLISKVKSAVGEKTCRLAVMHADVLEEALELKAQLSVLPHEGEIAISEVGPALGTHSGPGALAVAFHSV
jgi:DegV family protein with EDD domain